MPLSCGHRHYFPHLSKLQGFVQKIKVGIYAMHCNVWPALICGSWAECVKDWSLENGKMMRWSWFWKMRSYSSSYDGECYFFVLPTPMMMRLWLSKMRRRKKGAPGVWASRKLPGEAQGPRSHWSSTKSWRHFYQIKRICIQLRNRVNPICPSVQILEKLFTKRFGTITQTKPEIQIYRYATPGL